MKTIIQSTIHSDTCQKAGCSNCGQHHWRVSIAHRAEGALTGGIVVAWLMQGGRFEMPRNATAARNIRTFTTAKQANIEVEKAFSALRFCAELEATPSEKP